MSFEWRNQDDFNRRLAAGGDGFEDAVRKAVVNITAEVSGQAMKLAPVDEGTLRSSGSWYVDAQLIGITPRQGRKPKPNPNRTGGPEVARKPGRFRGVFGFNTPYAARQHEETGYRHPKGGKAKYAELAMKKVKPKTRGVIRKVMADRGF
jgi:hypothetical protein